MLHVILFIFQLSANYTKVCFNLTVSALSEVLNQLSLHLQEDGDVNDVMKVFRFYSFVIVFIENEVKCSGCVYAQCCCSPAGGAVAADNWILL